MRTLAIVVLSCLFGIACTMQGPKSSPAGEDLPSIFYTIDPTRDTTIVTDRGTWLFIPAGAFGDTAAGAASGAAAGSALGAAVVRIEVKEVYTIADIIRGRLITATHGEPLSSGGMIYINVAGEATMKLRKPIRVLLPTTGIQEGMQLYKGVKNAGGQIDWVDPKPLEKTAADSDLAEGKALFVSSCAACHGIGKAITGPPLGWICDREHDYKWLHDFIHDNTKLLARNDPYACYLFNRYNKTPMNVFPHLSDKDIDMILKYVMNASQTIDSSTVVNHRKSFDSCVRYNRLMASLVEKRRALKIAGSGAGTADKLPKAPPMVESFEFRYYQFEIGATGWYNCDRLVAGMDGVAESTVRVRVKGEHRQKADLYLVLPSVKVLMGVGQEPERLLLPQGQPAFILCMGEDRGQPFWGKVQWTIGLNQELTVEPVTMSKEAINAAVDQLHIDDLRVTVKDAKYVAETRSIDTATRVTDSLFKVVERLKPQFCDCDCHLVVTEMRDSAEVDWIAPPEK